MAAPTDDHAAALDRLFAALAATQGTPQPITTYGCLSFVPAREMGPDDDGCPVCGRPRHYRNPLPGDCSDGLVCGGCHRGSIRFDLQCEADLKRLRDREALRQHNLEVTKDTPRPAILDAPPVVDPIEPEPKPKLRQRKRPLAEPITA